jgi:hypothetical protein
MNPDPYRSPWYVDPVAFRQQALASSVKKGDLVKLTKGDEIRQARAHEKTNGELRLGNPYGPAVVALVRAGWTLEIVERFVPPAPPLPTEPGLYQDRDGDTWLLSRGEWTCVVYDGRSGDTSDIRDVASYLPLVRLTPVEESCA